MEKPMITINFESLIQKLNLYRDELMTGKLEDTITMHLIRILTKAHQDILDRHQKSRDEISTEITLKKPQFSDSVKVVTDPQTGERYGYIPFEHTYEFQMVKLTELLKNLGDGTYLITIVPKKEENGSSVSQSRS